MNLSAKTVVVIAIGAALYGIGGLPMFGIPVFANTTLKPAMAVLALFSVLFGPLVGFFGWFYWPLGHRPICRLGRMAHLGTWFRYCWFDYRSIPFSNALPFGER